jgi:hypothetical protein
MLEHVEIVHVDSPFVRAARDGLVLIVDEVDKVIPTSTTNLYFYFICLFVCLFSLIFVRLDCKR